MEVEVMIPLSVRLVNKSVFSVCFTKPLQDTLSRAIASDNNPINWRNSSSIQIMCVKASY